MNREIRLYRYLINNTGAHGRDQIMHYTGFPSPKTHPVAAYVEFHNAVMRLNARIAQRGCQIIRSEPRFVGDDYERYQLVSVKSNAA